MATTTTQQVTKEDIQFAKPQDIPQIVALGYKSFSDNNMEAFGVLPQFETSLKNTTNIVVNHVALVKRNEEDLAKIDGVIMFHPITSWWSDQTILSSTLFFIKPEKRSFPLALALLEASKEYAIMGQLPIIIDLVGRDNFKIRRIEKLLEYTGFERFGSYFIFSPDK